ncbi:MAG: alpha/beta fold hydrolase [Ardenticatenales bacterium]
MPILSLSTLDLYYEVHGPADAPPLVLLHGATETFEVSWKRLAGPLAKRYRVIGVDLRGHGKSTNPAGALDLRRMADDIVDLLDALGVADAHVCGFSGGASTTLFFGARHGDRARSLVLISNNFERDEARMARGFWSKEAIERRDALWIKGMERWHAVPPETLLEWWAAEDRVRPAFTAQELGALHMPVLVVGGDRDPVVPLDQTVRLYQALPNGQLAILPGVGHGAPHRAAVWLEMLLGSFIDGVEAARAAGPAATQSREDAQ